MQNIDPLCSQFYENDQIDPRTGEEIDINSYNEFTRLCGPSGCTQFRQDPSHDPLTGAEIEEGDPIYDMLNQKCGERYQPSEGISSRCQNFHQNPTVHPITQQPLDRASSEYWDIVNHCGSPVTRRESPRYRQQNSNRSPPLSPRLSSSVISSRSPSRESSPRRIQGTSPLMQPIPLAELYASSTQSGRSPRSQQSQSGRSPRSQQSQSGRSPRSQQSQSGRSPGSTQRGRQTQTARSTQTGRRTQTARKTQTTQRTQTARQTQASGQRSLTTEEICQEFMEDPTINPVTGRAIQPNGKVYKDLVQLCQSQTPTTTSSSPKRGRPPKSPTNQRSPKTSTSQRSPQSPRPELTNQQICQQFMENPTINPITGRVIGPNGKPYKDLVQLCQLEGQTGVSTTANISPKTSPKRGRPPKSAQTVGSPKRGRPPKSPQTVGSPKRGRPPKSPQAARSPKSSIQSQKSPRSPKPELTNQEICQQFTQNPSVNPITGRSIVPNGKVYHDLVKLCQQEQSQSSPQRGRSPMIPQRTNLSPSSRNQNSSTFYIPRSSSPSSQNQNSSTFNIPRSSSPSSQTQNSSNFNIPRSSSPSSRNQNSSTFYIPRSSSPSSRNQNSSTFYIPQ